MSSKRLPWLLAVGGCLFAQQLQADPPQQVTRELWHGMIRIETISSSGSKVTVLQPIEAKDSLPPPAPTPIYAPAPIPKSFDALSIPLPELPRNPEPSYADSPTMTLPVVSLPEVTQVSATEVPRYREEKLFPEPNPLLKSLFVKDLPQVVNEAPARRPIFRTVLTFAPFALIAVVGVLVTVLLFRRRTAAA